MHRVHCKIKHRIITTIRPRFFSEHEPCNVQWRLYLGHHLCQQWRISHKLCVCTYVEICGNKMPTRCNRGFYCRSYFLLNMFRAPLCPSSGAQEYYTVVAACGISCCKNVKSNFVSFLWNSTKNYKITFYIFVL